jgi:hypothetical protein
MPGKERPLLRPLALVVGLLLLTGAGALGQSVPPDAQSKSAIFNVQDYGAAGDGKALDTAAIRKAIQECAQRGGGMVTFPPGRYVTGTFELLSNVTLFLNAGAVIVGSTNLEDYGTIAKYGFGRDYGVNSTGEGFRVGLIVARGAENAAILGRGTIDGSGDAFMDLHVPHISADFDAQYTRQGKSFLSAMRDTEFGPVEPEMNGQGRPGTMVVFANCRNVLLRDITLLNAPNWTLHFQNSEGVVVSGVHIRSSLLIPNDDGVDCIGCRNVHVSDCDIQAGDDDFAFVNSEDVNVTNCSLVSRSSAIRLENTRYATFQNLVIHSNRGIGIYHRAGESTEDVLFADIAIETKLITGHWWGKAEPIYIAVSPAKPGQTPGYLRGVRFANIVGTAESGIVVYGSKDGIIQGLDFDHIKLRIVAPSPQIGEAVGGNFDLRWTATSLSNAIFKHDIPGIYCQYVEDFRIHDVQLQWGDNLPSYFSHGIECHDFQGLDIDHFVGRQAQRSSQDAVIALKEGKRVTIRNSTAGEGTGTFLSHSGVSEELLFVNNDLGAAKRVMRPSRSGFKMSGNILPPQPSPNHKDKSKS